MRAGTRKESVESRGGTAWNDWVYSHDGAGSLDGSLSTAQDLGSGTGSTGREGKDALGETSWFAPVEEFKTGTSVDTSKLPGFVSECTDGVCPVPWAKGIEALASAEFLTKDSNSNFPGENTIKELPEAQGDMVNHPSHYTDGSIECIEAIEAALTNEEFRGYCKGNCIKYIWRERQKGGLESLKKAQWYLNRLVALDELT